MLSAAPKPPTRKPMLTKVVKGKIKVADRILIHGVPGVGKTTFANGFPSPIFAEAGDTDGTARIDTSRVRIESWEDVLDLVEELATTDHDFKTFVIDTLDGLEPLLWAHICERDKKDSIESYGYGKGYVAAVEEWRLFLSRLERLRAAKGLGIVFLAHTNVNKFANPEGDDFDRYEMKLNKRAAALVSEWSDAILFARFEVLVDKNAETGRARGVSTGNRVLHTVRTAAYDAKNRYGLPETLPLDYAAFAAGVERGQPRDPAVIAKAIGELLAQLPELVEKVNPLLVTAGDNAIELSKIENRLKATLVQRQKESK